MKIRNEQSLRWQVEKWLAPAPATPIHVTRFSRSGRGGRRYVCVETSSPAGARTLFFFRHDDGSWCVFPPTADGRKFTAEPPVALRGPTTLSEAQLPIPMPALICASGGASAFAADGAATRDAPL
jgi:hypothetical protein